MRLTKEQPTLTQAPDVFEVHQTHDRDREGNITAVYNNWTISVRRGMGHDWTRIIPLEGHGGTGILNFDSEKKAQKFCDRLNKIISTFKD